MQLKNNIDNKITVISFIVYLVIFIMFTYIYKCDIKLTPNSHPIIERTKY
jgi:hypothetical protein